MSSNQTPCIREQICDILNIKNMADSREIAELEQLIKEKQEYAVRRSLTWALLVLNEDAEGANKKIADEIVQLKSVTWLQKEADRIAELEGESNG